MQSSQRPGSSAPPTRRKTLHTALSVEFIAAHTYRLTLERENFAFRAGQCANIGLGGSGLNREYSTYSAESAPTLAFLIRRVEGGLVSAELAHVRPGDAVEVDGPYGEFCIPDPKDGRRYVFIATGTGIAPFHSYVTSYPGLDYTIVHGIRHAEECYDRSDYEPGRYVACVSQGGGEFDGRVTDYLATREVDRSAVYFLCGNRMMINDVYDLLRDHRVTGSQIITETFF